MTHAVLTLCSVLLAAPSVRGTWCFVTTGNTSIPYIPDRHDWVSVCIFHGNEIPEGLQDNRSALTNWIMSASNDSILSVTQTSVPEPEPAKIRKSMTCAFCSESVMESHIQQLHEKPICIPCYEKQQKFDQNAAADTDKPIH
jgi:formylmethanofuran dehydrogenase subunit E